jgi:hypothetical protein
MIKLFSDIIITDGYSRSLLQDMGRGEYKFIPKLLSLKIKEYDGIYEYHELLKKFSCEQESLIFKEYFSFLSEHEYIFDIHPSQIQFLDEINTDFSYPFDITTIDLFIFSKNIDYIIQAIDRNLFINIPNFKLYIPNSISLDEIKNLIKKINKYCPTFVKIITNVPCQILESDLVLIENIDYEIDENYFKSKRYQEKFPMVVNGFIQYSEAIKYNPYFNKRVYIDNDCNVRCSPESVNIIANIKNIRTNTELIKSIFSNTEYKNLSNISRNKIEICKDCEIRNMCVYNSITIKNKKYWNMEINCCYNPYIAKWQNEDNYYTVEGCGNFNEQGQFIPDKEKIDKLNKEIWR